MKKVKISGQRARSIFASAMALTLALPTTLYVGGVSAQAAESESVLGQAVKTYDFESDAGMTFEGEQKLKLDENGKPVVSEDGQSYEKETSTALPEIAKDEEKGNVLKFDDSVKVDKYQKTEEDAKAAADAAGVSVVSEAAINEKYPVGSWLQLKERVGGRVKIDNPFKGMDLEKNGGVSISYWVKVPEIYEDSTTSEKVALAGDKLTSEQQALLDSKKIQLSGANSTTVVFNNTGRFVMNKDDYARYLACKEYDRASEAKDETSLADYRLGEQVIVTDNEGNAYVLYKNANYEKVLDKNYDTKSDPKADTHYGKLLRFNPSYPAQAASNEAASAVTGTGKVKAGGWIVPDQEKDGKITVTDAQGHTFKICSLQNRGSVVEDENQYDLYCHRYAETDDFEHDFSSKSKIREGMVRGSLQITTDNDFGFRADHYREDSYTDENGEVQKQAVDGIVDDNPNSAEYGKIQNLDGYNQLYFDGDEFVTNGKEADTADDDVTEEEYDRPAITGAEQWHYVTVVIEDDWVVTYVDGVKASPGEDYKYMKDTPGLSASVHDFGNMNTGKSYNKGKGLRGIYGKPATNVSEWPSDGTASASPANSLSATILEWIADDATELYLGGTGFSSEYLTQGYGTIKDVCLDDVSFFSKALSTEEAIQLYGEAAAAAGMAKKGDVDGSGDVDLDDALLTLKIALKIQADATPQQVKAADVDGDGDVTLDDAQKILKVALRIDSF